MKNQGENFAEPHDNYEIQIQRGTKDISGWPTDVFDIDYYSKSHNVKAVSSSKDQLDLGSVHRRLHPHTVIMFIPGNPGCSGWYIQMLKSIVQRLGIGYAARAVSYAGHGTDHHIVGSQSTSNDGIHKRKSHIAWTIDGQMEHKIIWVDMVMDGFINSIRNGHRENYTSTREFPHIIFLSHSFGAHLVQRICILRKDVLARTKAVIHLTPFFRFDPHPRWKNAYLSSVANAPQLAIWILRTCSKFAAKMPQHILDFCLKNIAEISLAEDRELARGLIINPEYARNFLMLGLEEIRDVPKVTDSAAMRVIGQYCPTYILYCGGEDQWACEPHMQDLKQAKTNGEVPKNVNMEYESALIHGFIVFPQMIDPVVQFVCRSVAESNKNESVIATTIRSKL